MFALATLTGAETTRWLAALADASIKGSAVLLLAGLANLLLARRPAALRHLIWSLSAASLFVIPALSIVLPRWHVPVLPQWPLAVGGTRFVGSGGHDQAWPSRSAVGGTRFVGSGGHDQAWPSGSAWVLLAWAAGALATAAPLLLGAVNIRRQTRKASRVSNPEWLALADALARQFGLRRSVTLFSTTNSQIPVTWDFLRPVILLPAEAADWPAGRLRAVLLHELGHIRRADCLTMALARLARILYWFNPLVWWALHRVRIEREQACDDLVIEAGFRPSEYADHLLDIVRHLRRSRCESPAAIAMARKSQFEGRLLAILDEQRNRTKLTLDGAALVGALFLSLLVPLAMLGAETGKPGGDAAPQVSATSQPAEESNPLVTTTSQPASRGVTVANGGTAAVSTTAPDLSGTWEITWPWGRKAAVNIQRTAANRYLYLLAKADYLTGLYEVQGNKLVLVDNLGQRISRCTWQIMDADHLVVLIAPPTREIGPNFSGTPLTRAK